MTIDDLVSKYSGVYPENELRAMNYIAGMIKTGAVLSVGSQRGLMDFSMALTSPVPVYAITGGKALTNRENQLWADDAERLGVSAKIERADGETWDKPIGLLWVDGSLSADALSDNLTELLPQVVPGGYIGFNHADTAEVKAAIKAASADHQLRLVETGDGGTYTVYQYDGPQAETAKPVRAVAAPKAVNVPAPKAVQKVAAKPAAKKRPAPNKATYTGKTK